MAKKTNEKKYKHLTPEDRRQIEECLGKRMTFKSIGKLLQKDPTTISYEIKHHRIEHRNSFSKLSETCPNLLKAPFVCNGCQKKSSSACQHVRYYYRAAAAQEEYKTTLIEAREGTPLNKQSFYEIDRIISEGLDNGQHIYQIMTDCPQITCSKSTVYRHFHKGYYSATLMKLPRAVKFKPRQQKYPQSVPARIRNNRTYNDFIAFCEEHDIEAHVELDTVIGRSGGKVILTILFSSCNFMVGLLLNNKTAAEAATKFSAFKKSIRDAGFSINEVFPVLLTDNGSEFSDVFSFENDEHDTQETLMFFCDPMRSCQKPQVEKNHTLFRDIVPKASSFDDFTQETVNLIFSHVNSAARKIYHGKSAYDMFCFYFSEELAALMGIERIPKEQVIQSPILLKGIADLNKNR